MFDLTQKDLLLVILGGVVSLVVVGIWAKLKLIPSLFGSYITKLNDREEERGRILAEDNRQALGLLGFLMCSGVGIQTVSIGILVIALIERKVIDGLAGPVGGFCVGLGLQIFWAGGMFHRMAKHTQPQH